TRTLEARLRRLNAQSRAANTEPGRALLPSDLRRLLVVAQPEIHRVAQLVVVGPLRELHLRDELGSDPVWPLVGLRPVLERAGRGRARRQQLHHPRELFLVEAG